MVAKRLAYLMLVFTFVFIPIGTASYCIVTQASPTYHFSHQWSKIWVNADDGSIDLLYDINITCDSGSFSYVEVGQPVSDFTVTEAKDSVGRTLTTEKIVDGSYYAVRVRFTTLAPGRSIAFTVLTNVLGMFYPDNTNPGNVGMLFQPTWWPALISDLRVLIVLPLGPQQTQVKTLANVPYDNIYRDANEGGRLVLFWQRLNVLPNTQLSFGVSFPQEFIKSGIHYTGIDWLLRSFLPRYWFLLLGGGLISVFGVLIARNYLSKASYEKPKMKMESLGIRRGLTAVEASWLLGLGPQKVAVAMLYSLLKKRAVWVKEAKPVLKLEAVPLEKEQESLRYYELSLLKSIGEDGVLDERRLAGTVMQLRDTVEEKLRGYSRGDTVTYYRSIVDEAWTQVKSAGTPELAANAFDEQLLWLMLDENFKTKTSDMLGPMYIPPNRAWWWYWWWRYPSPIPPNRGPGPSSDARTPLPGGEFADKIASSLENAAGGLVKNLENFANAIVPSSAPASANRPIRQGSSCACACVSCACACACVSCACACAGGRVGK